MIHLMTMITLLLMLLPTVFLIISHFRIIELERRFERRLRSLQNNIEDYADRNAVLEVRVQDNRTEINRLRSMYSNILAAGIASGGRPGASTVSARRRSNSIRRTPLEQEYLERINSE